MNSIQKIINEEKRLFQIEMDATVTRLNDDTETTRIDTLIAKQEKLIELLEELRKSIISHVVTKGLNLNAPMKDSCVEWLEEVHEHWSENKICI